MLRHNSEEPTSHGEIRYDRETLRQVTVLAQELRRSQSDSLTAQEIEEIGTEAGLDASTIRQALKSLNAERVRTLASSAFWDQCRKIALYSVPVLWAVLGCLLLKGTHLPLWTGFQELFIGGRYYIHSGESIAQVAAAKEGLKLFLATAPCFSGLLVGPLAMGRGRSFWAGVAASMGASLGLMAGALGVWTEHQVSSPLHLEIVLALALMILCAPVSGLFGVMAAEVRDVVRVWFGRGGKQTKGIASAVSERSTAPSSKGCSRQQIIRQLLELQSQLENQEMPRTFLSIDVVGSTRMKKDAPAIEAEYSFDQFRRWVEDEVHARGGEVQSAAGDGFMCMFANEQMGLRTAAALQAGMEVFNRERNKMRTDFQIRCGLGAGRVPLADGVSIGHLQSAVLDRAAKLQKGTVAGAIAVAPELVGAAQELYGSTGVELCGEEPGRVFTASRLPPIAPHE